MSDEYKQLSIGAKSRLWGGVAVGAALFAGVVVGQFEREAVAETAAYSAGVIVLTGWTFWSERRWQWFWYFMAAVVVAHIAAVLTAPWPLHHDMTKAAVLLGIGDLLLTLTCGALIGYVARKIGNGAQTLERIAPKGE